MFKYSGILMWMLCSTVAGNEPRIHHWERCGDLLDVQRFEICLTVSGTLGTKPVLNFNGKSTEIAAGQMTGDRLRVNLARSDFQSGPLWLAQGNQSSNAVWISRGGSHVMAAVKADVMKNAEGIDTYLNLVSLIIEERYDGLAESRALAKKYGAAVVGAIPPLNLYQLRLPAKNLTERDALVLRLGSEVQVDAVVIEETSAEQSAEGEPTQADAEIGNQEHIANRFVDAVDFYRRRAPGHKLHPIKIGVVERDLDFDAPDFRDYLRGCHGVPPRICLYARDAATATQHGSTVVGLLAAAWNNGGNDGFLRGLEPAGPRFDIIVDRNSDAGVTANIAASVNLVEDGVRVLNWSWGFHRIGTRNTANETLDSAVRTGIAMSGYEELLEEFFIWLRHKHPDVIVINSAGNGSAFAGQDEYRLPSSLVTEQLLVVAGHERTNNARVNTADPEFVRKRDSSNLDSRVDISASACSWGATRKKDDKSEMHCGTSYATPLVTATVAAMLSINPSLTPEQIRILLRRSAMTVGSDVDFEIPEADDLTAPILPSERNQQLEHPEIGLSARLDMAKALELTVQSLSRAR